MIRRNFVKIAAGAIAALFVPKVASALQPTEHWMGPFTLGKTKTIPFPSHGVVNRYSYAPGSGEKLYFLGKDGLHEFPDHEDVIRPLHMVVNCRRRNFVMSKT